MIYAETPALVTILRVLTRGSNVAVMRSDRLRIMPLLEPDCTRFDHPQLRTQLSPIYLPSTAPINGWNRSVMASWSKAKPSVVLPSNNASARACFRA